MVWGAAWLYKATKESTYWNFVKGNMQSLESTSYFIRNVNGFPVQNNYGGSFAEFGWDAKTAGINVLISQVSQRSL